MKNDIKNQANILQKLGINQLNPMQKEALRVIPKSRETILLSPTGTGKTLAFMLPLLKILDENCTEIQVLILVPSRELALQIEQVCREMGTGYKVNAVYGGKSFSKDKIELNHPPAFLVGTPGRVADHLRRGTFSCKHINTLVLDEFDKSLEIGFEEEMSEIMEYLPFLERKVLTSATNSLELPDFVGIHDPTYIEYLKESTPKLTYQTVVSPSKDKLDTLLDTLCHIGNHPGIIFCNFKDSIQRVSDFLEENGIKHGCFYGGLDQKDREGALIQFRNGTYNLLLATDLAARGLDIPELKFILHYHLPLREEEFIHRNGRTGRMNAEGTIYILKGSQEKLPDFIADTSGLTLTSQPLPEPPEWCTLFLSGGRKDKISKGDIAGLFFKQTDLEPEELGRIEIKQDCAFVAVKKSKAAHVIEKLDPVRLKKKKIRVRWM